MDGIERDGIRASAREYQPKLVVFVLGRFVSHFNTTLALARALRRRGKDVEYWAEEDLRGTVERQGFAFYALREIWPFYLHYLPDGLKGALLRPRELWVCATALRNRALQLERALDTFEDSLQPLLAEHRPSLAIFHPFAFAYFPYFRMRQIACVGLLDKPLPLRDDGVPPPSTGALLPSGRLGAAWHDVSWRNYWLAAWRRRLKRRLLRALGFHTTDALLAAIARRTLPLHPPVRIERGLEYDLHFDDVDEWIVEVPELDFPRRKLLPENIRYVGHAADLERREMPLEITRAPDTRHLIYVAMGTVARRPRRELRVLQRICRALSRIPGAEIVVAAGQPLSERDKQSFPPNVQIHEAVPQLAVLGVADLAVTHGGANTIRECLLTRTPMLAIPREFDQVYGAARVTLRGWGLRASRWMTGGAELRRRALLVLGDPGFRARLEHSARALEHSENGLLDAALARATEPVEARGQVSQAASRVAGRWHPAHARSQAD